MSFALIFAVSLLEAFVVAVVLRLFSDLAPLQSVCGLAMQRDGVVVVVVVCDTTHVRDPLSPSIPKWNVICCFEKGSLFPPRSLKPSSVRVYLNLCVRAHA